MKPRVFVVWMAGCASIVALAADGSGTKNTVRINLDEQPAAPAANKTAEPSTQSPGAKTTPAKKGDKTEKEKIRKVEGFEISRGDKGFLGLKVDDNHFIATFYDKDKKPVPADVTSVALRWPVQYQPNAERTLLLPTADAKVMASEKTVRPPFHFKLFVALLKQDAAGQDQAVENYVVDFAQ